MSNDRRSAISYYDLLADVDAESDTEPDGFAVSPTLRDGSPSVAVDAVTVPDGIPDAVANDADVIPDTIPDAITDAVANAVPDIDTPPDSLEGWEEVNHWIGHRSVPPPCESSDDEWWHSTDAGFGNGYRAADTDTIPVAVADTITDAIADASDRDVDVIPDTIPDAITDAVANDADALHDSIPDADADGMRDAGSLDADGRAASVGVAVGVPDSPGLYEIALGEVQDDPVFDVSFLRPYGTPYGEGFSNGVTAIHALRSLFPITVFKIGVCVPTRLIATTT